LLAARRRTYLSLYSVDMFYAPRIAPLSLQLCAVELLPD
jgi:hypothetical protein